MEKSNMDHLFALVSKLENNEELMEFIGGVQQDIEELNDEIKENESKIDDLEKEVEELEDKDDEYETPNTDNVIECGIGVIEYNTPGNILLAEAMDVFTEKLVGKGAQKIIDHLNSI